MPEKKNAEEITGHGVQKKLSRNKNTARLKKTMDNGGKKQIKHVLTLQVEAEVGCVLHCAL